MLGQSGFQGQREYRVPEGLPRKIARRSCMVVRSTCGCRLYCVAVVVGAEEVSAGSVLCVGVVVRGGGPGV